MRAAMFVVLGVLGPVAGAWAGPPPASGAVPPVPTPSEPAPPRPGSPGMTAPAVGAPTPDKPKAAEARPREPFTATIDADGVLDRNVVAQDGTVLGHVVDVLIDPSAQPRAAVLEIGGFMGVGDRRVAVGWSDLRFPPPGGKSADIRTDLTPAQMRDTPEFKPGTAARVIEPANPLQGSTPGK